MTNIWLNKALEIKTAKVFNWDFANNTILLCFFHIFLIIDLHFSIPVVITQTFNPIVELAIPVGISTKEEKSEMERHLVIVETAISQCLI